MASTYVAEAMRWLAPYDEAGGAHRHGTIAGRRRGDRPTVLVADDNPDMRRYVAGLLADAYDVVTAEDGAAALEAARSIHPDLVLSDVMMPNLDGFGLLQALRADAATAGNAGHPPVRPGRGGFGRRGARGGSGRLPGEALLRRRAPRQGAVEPGARADPACGRAPRARDRRRAAGDARPEPVRSARRCSRSPPTTSRACSGPRSGGDWFEAIDLGRARTALVVGDVMGKGIRAAATMGQLRSVVRAYAGLDLSPADLLEAVDARVRELGTDQIASCIYAVVDSRSSLARVRQRRAPPAAARQSRRQHVERLDAPLGPPLGAGPVALRQGEVRLEPGSMLVLYTDGLVETRAGDTDERIDRVAEIATSLDRRHRRPARGPGRRTLCPSGSSDDVAILVARVQPVGHLPTSETLIEPDLDGGGLRPSVRLRDASPDGRRAPHRAISSCS